MIVQKNIWDNGNWMTPTFVTASLLLTQNTTNSLSNQYDFYLQIGVPNATRIPRIPAMCFVTCCGGRHEPRQKAHQNSSANSMAKFAQNLRSAPKL